MKLLLIGIITIFSGLVQAITGFGSGIVNMLFFAKVMPINIAPSVSELISIPLSMGIFLNYRNNIKKEKVILPAIFFSIGSSIAINIVKEIDLNNLKIVFSLFLTLLGIFNLFFADKIHVNNSIKTTFLFSFISGIIGGMFGIGGPLMVIYYLAITDSKEEYLGTINCLFTITSIYRVFFRILNKLFYKELIQFTLIGFIGIMIGKYLGQKIVNKINGSKLKKYIYIFLIISGIISVINAIK